MRTIGKFSLVGLAVALLFSAGNLTAETETTTKPHTLASLTKDIEKLDKKEIAVTGKIVGVCKSGCKMWIADGEYKEGEPFALVRAKDDAFKFDKQATGKEVVLYGYAVAKYMDYCSESGKEQEGAMDKCETPVEASAEKKKKTEKGKVVDVTFFATKVEYR